MRATLPSSAILIELPGVRLVGETIMTTTKYDFFYAIVRSKLKMTYQMKIEAVHKSRACGAQTGKLVAVIMEIMRTARQTGT
jgi:hypothetical protein